VNERTNTRQTYTTTRRENFSRLFRKESREEILQKKNGTRCEYRSSERGGVHERFEFGVFAMRALKIRFFFFPSSQILSSSNSFRRRVLSLFLSFCCYLRMMIISFFFDVALVGTSSSSSFHGLGKEKKNIQVVVHLR
jgi:hypothetical protein